MFIKKKNGQVIESVQKKKNFCSRLYQKKRKKLFNKLNPSFANDNKLKNVKPFFSSSGSSIKLVEKDEVLQDDKKLLKN